MSRFTSYIKQNKTNQFSICNRSCTEFKKSFSVVPINIHCYDEVDTFFRPDNEVAFETNHLLITKEYIS